MYVTSKDIWPAVHTWRPRRPSFLKAEKITAIPARRKEPAPRDGLAYDSEADGLVIREKPARGQDPMEK